MWQCWRGRGGELRGGERGGGVGEEEGVWDLCCGVGKGKTDQLGELIEEGDGKERDEEGVDGVDSGGKGKIMARDVSCDFPSFLHMGTSHT